MKTESSQTNKLPAFLRKHAPAGNALRAATEPESMDLVDLFVHSFLLWQAPTADANAALKRVREAFIDWNDFRVSLDSDVIDVIGRGYWRAQERVSRMRESMNDVYRREHRVSLDRLRTLMKKDAVSYMETLRGMMPFVANRVLLIGVEFHAIPLDEFGLNLLLQQGVVPAGSGLTDAIGWLARHVKAEEARETHRAILAATDAMWASNPPKQPKHGSRPSELAPPKSVEEARADAQALVEQQLAAEREAVAAERAARREEARALRLAQKAKEARDEARRAGAAAKGKSASARPKAAARPGARVAKVVKKSSKK
ncbi:MAG: hypothetical protein U0636_10655 [Phycisphaerales bacterium]